MTQTDAFPRRMWAAFQRYGLSVLLVVVALLVTLLLRPVAVVTPLFFPAIMLAAWFGGMGPGLVAVVLSSLAVDYFLLEPIHEIAWDLAAIPLLLGYATCAFFVSWLSAGRRRAEDSLRRAHGDMEAKVQERTAELKSPPKSSRSRSPSAGARRHTCASRPACSTSPTTSSSCATWTTSSAIGTVAPRNSTVGKWRRRSGSARTICCTPSSRRRSTTSIRSCSPPIAGRES
jgi:K+-sensing histidine kinase KdpD